MAIKYLLTGAAGNLGGSILRELKKNGADIRALVLPGDKAAQRIPPGVEIIEGDILNKNDLQNFFTAAEGVEVIVIHTAAIVTTEWNYIKAVHDVNVEGTRNIVEQCLKSGVKRLVHVSSVHAIPELPKGQVMTEVTNFNPGNIIGFYGKTKAEASGVVMDAIREKGLDAVIVFPTGLCGPYDYAMGYMTQLMADCMRNRLPAGIEGGFDFVDVRDVAAGVVSASKKGRKGEGYILGNRYIPVREVLRHVHEKSGARLVKHMLPVWAARILVPFFGIYYKARKTHPLFNRYSLHTLTTNSVYSSEKARRELGYTVRPFEQTVADTLKWLKDEKIYEIRTVYRSRGKVGQVLR